MDPSPSSSSTPTAASDTNYDGIDVQQAIEAFNSLERQLSRTSSLKHTDLNADPEKANQSFILRDYLASANAANDEAGIHSHHKRVGVSWDNLEVIVPGGAGHKIYVQTFDQAVINFFLDPVRMLNGALRSMFSRRRKMEQESPALLGSTILHRNSGLLKPGEMCLVLGCPGAGCTTFLKVIANRRTDYAYVGGDVHYAGIDAVEMAKQYKGEVVYNQEDDIHIPSLTVAQTLNFALSTKTPANRLPGVSSTEFNAQLLDTFLRMFNIQHTANTLVGDAFIRGVSGGERKRVSIAEMMATRAHVTCWDNSTRGLDASTALDYVKSLRVLTDLLKQTTFVTLYQASESIYKQFDKVLLLDKGRVIYFGPANQARNYFVKLGYKDLPRQTTADYLTGCTDPNERQFAKGQTAETVPSTPQALESAWRQSDLHAKLTSARHTYDAQVLSEDDSDQRSFRAAVINDKKRGVSKQSPYTLGLAKQTVILTKRQMRLRLQDWFQLLTSFGTSTVLAIILGATFFKLPATASGGFTRGSILFIGMLVIGLDAFGEMPAVMLGRPILYKQAAFGFYRPAALALANLLSDLPFSAARVLIFNIIIYFMCGLSLDAGAFFTYALFQYLTFLTMQATFRLLGALLNNFDVAFRVATVILPNFIAYAGYLRPPNKMKRWLFWIYYTSPLSYGFGGLMENEFMRTNLVCEGAFVVPRNGNGVTKYPNSLGPHQACTLAGSPPASDVVNGKAYIQDTYDLDFKDLWRREFLVLLGMFLVFTFLQTIVFEYYRHNIGGGGLTLYARENADTRERNRRLLERRAKKTGHSEKSESGEKTPGGDEIHELEEEKPKHSISSGQVFTWENLNYHVPVPGGQRRLLHDVFGYVKPASLTALMGASGAGKTTCLDVLAQRKNIGVVSGDVLVGGRPLQADFARGTAYAEQLDVHEGTATIREAMRFSAYLRQPFSVPKREKDDYVEEMIELLELQDLADAVVFSLGVEARKRLTIGVELAAKPELLLFLDEPTSGLDGQSAWNLVRFLRKLADAGQAILCTIHQPSALLFESFDRLLLLESGGETVYFGDIGKDAYVIRDYFARHGAVCPADGNPAEFMLEAIGAGVTPRIGSRDWKDIWLDSPECAKAKEEIAQMKAEALARPAHTNVELTQTYAAPFYYQVTIVTKRALVALWRSHDYLFSRLFSHISLSLFISLALLRLGRSVGDLQSRVFGIFFATVMPAIVMFQIEPAFINNRSIFIREASSRIYSSYVFAIGQLVSETPYSVLCAFLYWALFVWPMGFGQGAEGTRGNGYQLLVCIFLEMFGVSLGQLLGAISPRVQIAALFNPILNLVLSTFAGVTIPFPQLARFWRDTIYQITPYTRVLSGMLSTELHGLVITCLESEFAVFDPPANQTCQQWAGDFVNANTGYLNNPNATSHCQYCQYRVGDQFFEPLDIKFDHRWRDAFILFGFIVANFAFTIIASRFLRYAKR